MLNLHTFHASVRAKGVIDLASVTDARLVLAAEAKAPPQAASELELLVAGREVRQPAARAAPPSPPPPRPFRPPSSPSPALGSWRPSARAQGARFRLGAADAESSLAWLRAIQGALRGAPLEGAVPDPAPAPECWGSSPRHCADATTPQSDQVATGGHVILIPLPSFLYGKYNEWNTPAGRTKVALPLMDTGGARLRGGGVGPGGRALTHLARWRGRSLAAHGGATRKPIVGNTCSV
jgi:hypothetical protein